MGVNLGEAGCGDVRVREGARGCGCVSEFVCGFVIVMEGVYMKIKL